MADSRLTDSRSNGIKNGALLALALIGIAVLSLAALSAILQGGSSLVTRDPASWLAALEPELAVDTASNAADLLAAILAIAVTVVAIVVELAANRYNHRITSLFIREPINIVVLSFFVVATANSVWVGLLVSDSAATGGSFDGALLLALLLLFIALIILLPYFAFVLSFLSPISIIGKIRGSTLAALDTSSPAAIRKSKDRIRTAVDELQDIARRAAELSDRAVAMASINALAELVLNYQQQSARLPDAWYALEENDINDPDFVSLSRHALIEIESGNTWFEVKVMRQYLDLISDSNMESRDISYLIAINTKQIGIANARRSAAVVELCIHCFNSYLRATINKEDQRTSYYIMNQYRLLAEHLLTERMHTQVEAIARHFQFYGLLGFKQRIPFLLEVAAYDIMHLVEQCADCDSELIDALLELLLTLDQETRRESQEDSLLGVRRAHIQLAAYFLELGDEARARRICTDLAGERPERLRMLHRALLAEDRPQYWEFTDRGVNFAYLAPGLRRHLDTILRWSTQAA